MGCEGELLILQDVLQDGIHVAHVHMSIAIDVVTQVIAAGKDIGEHRIHVAIIHKSIAIDVVIFIIQVGLLVANDVEEILPLVGIAVTIQVLIHNVQRAGRSWHSIENAITQYHFSWIGIRVYFQQATATI